MANKAPRPQLEINDNEFTDERIKEISSILGLTKDEEADLRNTLHNCYYKLQGMIQEMMANRLGENTENMKLAQKKLKDILDMFPQWRLEQRSSGGFYLLDDDEWNVSGWMGIKYEYNTFNWKKVAKEKVEIDWKKFANYAEKTSNQKLAAYLVAKKLGTDEVK